MRRLLRWSLSGLCLLSLLPCAGTACLWWRGLLGYEDKLLAGRRDGSVFLLNTSVWERPAQPFELLWVAPWPHPQLWFRSSSGPLRADGWLVEAKDANEWGIEIDTRPAVGGRRVDFDDLGLKAVYGRAATGTTLVWNRWPQSRRWPSPAPVTFATLSLPVFALPIIFASPTLLWLALRARRGILGRRRLLGRGFGLSGGTSGKGSEWNETIDRSGKAVP